MTDPTRSPHKFKIGQTVRVKDLHSSPRSTPQQKGVVVSLTGYKINLYRVSLDCGMYMEEEDALFKESELESI